MASLALGAVGAGVGSIFGYASIGWSIGSFIGGQLFGQQGQDIKGPRLSDKSVSTSAYGNMRPVILGGYRTGGEVIWSTDLKEHAHKEEAGKGGGGGGSYTSYTYTVSFALALCKGTISGVRKMWFDGRLVYSNADDANNAELQASETLAKSLAFYTGNTTQGADPTMEAYLGVGNVPGYRGTAYIVFTDLDVTKYGNRIPQITVEVVQNGSYTIVGSAISSGGTSARQSLFLYKGIANAFNWGYTYAGGTTDGLFEQRSYSLVTGTVAAYKRAFAFGAALGSGSEGFGWRYLYAISMSPSGKFAIAEGGDSGSGANHQYHLLARNSGVLSNIAVLPTTVDLDAYENGTDRSYNLLWEDEYNIWFYKFNSGEIYHYEIVVTQLGDISVLTTSFNVDSTRSGLDPNGDNADDGAFCIDRGTGDIYVEVITYGSSTYCIKRFSRDGTLLETKFSGVNWRSYQARLMAFSEGLLYEVNGRTLEIYDWDSETLLGSSPAATDNTYVTGAIMEASGTLLTVLANGTLHHFSRRLNNSGIALDVAVSTICTSAGMATGEIDVTDLAADTLRGFMIAQQGPARGALEQLSAAFFFDARSSDGVLEFVKRGDVPTVTLDDDDLGCYEGEDVQELADATRTQEEELPKALTLNYANVGADFQVGAQHSLRQSVLNGTESTIQLPIALNDTEAKKIVDTMMFAAWQNRHQFVLKTWQANAKIEPADVISARGETLRVVSRSEGVNGIIELTAVRELPSIYTGQVGSGSTSGYTSQSVSVGGPTDYRLLDIPPLRDVDYNNYGLYWVAAGYLSDWPGAALLRSTDAGTTWGYEYSQDTAGVFGFTSTALANFTGCNIFDEQSVLRVTVNGTLESKTETEVLNGANPAMVGSEMIQFKNATLVSTGVYDLTGLLRGRMGTEWAISTHTAYEDFTLLTSSAARFVDVPISDLNTVRDWGCITHGDTIADIVQKKVTYAGTNLKPLPPVEIGGGVTGYNGTWTINWKRRSRYNWQWLDTIDVGADEASYNFEVAIMSGSTVIRTLTVTGAQTTTYTYAQQSTDFGAFQSLLYVKIRQVGATKNSEWSDVVLLRSGYVSQTVLLLHFDGTNASTTFTDEKLHTVTANGDAQLSTSDFKFGTASGLFDGTGDYLTVPEGVDFNNFTSSDSWTVEFFLKQSSNTTGCCVCIGDNAGGLFAQFSVEVSGANQNIYLRPQGGATGYWKQNAYAFDTNWNHYAFVCNAGSFAIYRNGTSIGALTGFGWSTANAPVGVIVGAAYLAGYTSYLNGRLDELRISKTALYTSNFTAPIAPFTD